MENWIKENIEKKIELLETLQKTEYFEMVATSGHMIAEALKNGNKVLLAGNGGSAADAQHFAGEIVGRFLKERPALPAVALCVDPSVVTSIANDYGYEEVFARQLDGLGKRGDIFVPISTSGHSKNLIKAIEIAHKKKIRVIGYLGNDGGDMKRLCDIALVVPSDSTPRIQEMHIFTTHILCEIIEREVFL